MYLKHKKKMMAAIFTIIFLISADRLLKYLALNNYFQPAKPLIANIFKLSYAENYNIAFSLPLSGWQLNILISLIILALIYKLLYFYKKKQTAQVILLLVIILGAVSNLSDRFKYGFVVDYLDLKYFTVFNLADVMIVGSVISLGWSIFKKAG